MSYLKYILLIITFLSFTVSANSQTKKANLESKKKKTQEEIKYTEKLLKETQANKKNSLNELLIINKNIGSRKALIQSINEEIEMTEESIKETEFIIGMLESDLEILKKSYSEMIRIAWKNQNKNNQLMFLLSSEDFNQAFLRLKYMQQLSKHRQKQLKVISVVKSILESQTLKLKEIKQSKQSLLNQERDESNKLISEQVKRKKTVDELKSQENKLKKKLQENKKQAAQIQIEIEKLIRAEAKKAGKKNAAGKISLSPEEKIVSTNFGKNMGRLPWPVEKGVIVSSFGKQAHPVLSKVEIDNTGIDISTTEGSEARAIFDGEVRKVFALPGANTAIIIKHGEYFSVYTQLEKAYVKTGDKVSRKQAIGKIYTDKSENKTLIHLEVWKGDAVLNPALWLAK